MADFKMGTDAVLAIYRGDRLLWRWSMPNLFLGDKAGHWAGGYAQTATGSATLQQGGTYDVLTRL